MSTDKNKKTIQGCLGCFAICFVLSLLIGVYTWLAPEKAPAMARESDNKLLASTLCKQFTEKRLKSPGSADWPWVHSSDITTRLAKNRYRVRTYVDSQNSFGAAIRTQVDCTVRLKGKSEGTLETLNLN